jgi:hypothetical protein
MKKIIYYLYVEKNLSFLIMGWLMLISFGEEKEMIKTYP